MAENGRPLLVTNSGPHPADFELESLKSRAAAKAMLERAEREPKPMVRIVDEGRVVHEYECEGLDQDINVQIILIGREKEAHEPRETETPPLAVPSGESTVTDNERARSKQLSQEAGPGPLSEAPQQPVHSVEPKSSEERWQRFIEARKRALVRKPPYRRHAWPPSAYGA